MSEEEPAKPEKSLLGWFKNTVNQLQGAAKAPAPAQAPPAVNKPGAPAGRPTPSSRLESSLSLAGPGAPPRRAANTGALGPTVTNPLVPPQGPKLFSDEISPPGNPSPQAPSTGALPPTDDPEADSKKRMKVITGYLKDPNGHPLFADKPAFLKILTEERSHLHTLIHATQKQLQSLPPPAAAMGLTPEEAEQLENFSAQQQLRAELEAKLAKCQQRQAQIYQIMKRLTGIKKSTGGTGFLALPNATADEPPAAPGSG